LLNEFILLDPYNNYYENKINSNNLKDTYYNNLIIKITFNINKKLRINNLDNLFTIIGIYLLFYYFYNKTNYVKIFLLAYIPKKVKYNFFIYISIIIINEGLNYNIFKKLFIKLCTNKIIQNIISKYNN
jgi:hypothetical protein